MQYIMYLDLIAARDLYWSPPGIASNLNKLIIYGNTLFNINANFFATIVFIYYLNLLRYNLIYHYHIGLQ